MHSCVLAANISEKGVNKSAIKAKDVAVHGSEFLGPHVSQDLYILFYFFLSNQVYTLLFLHTSDVALDHLLRCI